jgi:hypothetical protein
MTASCPKCANCLTDLDARIERAVEAALARRKVDPKQLEDMVGHAAAEAMGKQRRSALARITDGYRFRTIGR